jgi:hypothetical protein
MSHFDEALRCAERALRLVADLTQVRNPADLRQVSAGARGELECVIREISDGLDEQRRSATANREGKVRDDALSTSKATARNITVKSGSQRALVLLALYHRGDLTDFELQEILSLSPSSQRPRRGELVDAGFVRPVLNGEGMGITKRHNGNDWQLWQLTDDGESVASGLTGAGPPAPKSSTQPQVLF